MHESLWHRLLKGVRRLHHHPLWTQFVPSAWADTIMSAEVTDRFHAKQGRSIARWTLPGKDSTLVVYLKRQYRLPWRERILAVVWPRGHWSPALKEWDHLRWAAAHGLPVPRAMAAGEFIGPGVRLQSFIAVEELYGMNALHEAIPRAAAQLDPLAFRRWKWGLIREMARLAHELHDRRYFHQDFYLCHFYIHEADTRTVPEWRGRVFLIDLHRLTHRRRFWRWWQTKDLGQLLYSSDVAGVTARDRLDFWRVYCGSRPHTHPWSRRAILLRWQRYRQHNRKRPAIPSPGQAA